MPVPCAEKPFPEEDWSSQPVSSLCRVIVVSVTCVIREDVANDAKELSK